MVIPPEHRTFQLFRSCLPVVRRNTGTPTWCLQLPRPHSIEELVWNTPFVGTPKSCANRSAIEFGSSMSSSFKHSRHHDVAVWQQRVKQISRHGDVYPRAMWHTTKTAKRPKQPNDQNSQNSQTTKTAKTAKTAKCTCLDHMSVDWPFHLLLGRLAVGGFL